MKRKSASRSGRLLSLSYLVNQIGWRFYRKNPKLSLYFADKADLLRKLASSVRAMEVV